MSGLSKDSSPQNTYSPQNGFYNPPRTAAFFNREKLCPLLDESLPIVTEFDHKVANCYCHLCNCGQHYCPAEAKPNINYPKYQSIYRNQFRGKKTPPPQPYDRSVSYQKCKFKLDSITTKINDFKNHRNQETHKPEQRPKSVQRSNTLRMKFIASSNYQKDFPNWEAKPLQKLLEQPSHSGKKIQLKFNAESTYSRNFTGKLPSESKNVTRSVSPILNSQRMFLGETTHRKEYQQYNKEHFAKKALVKPEKSPEKVLPPSQYQTQYSNQYKLLPLKKKFTTKRKTPTKF